jgi:hypothetical protein
MAEDEVPEAPEIDRGLFIAKVENAVAVSRPDRLLEHHEKVIDAGLAGAIRSKQDRQRRQMERACVAPCLEVVNPKLLEHCPSLLRGPFRALQREAPGPTSTVAGAQTGAQRRSMAQASGCAAVSKTVSGSWVRRGFKSLPLRSTRGERRSARSEDRGKRLSGGPRSRSGHTMFRFRSGSL